MSFAAIAIGSSVVGTGLSLYGANKQAKANAKAQDQNVALQNQQNQSAWASYLMSRGIAPTGPVTPGVLPQRGQYRAVNQRLPLYATMKPSSGAARWQKRAT